MLRRISSWKVKLMKAAFAIYFAFVLLIAAALPAAADSDVSSFKASMEKWVETNQLLSKETAEWRFDSESMKSVVTMLEREQRALEAEIAELEASSTHADDERRDLMLERGELQRGSRYLKTRIEELEVDVKQLVGPLPDPLKKKLEPLMVQIPDDPEFSRVPLGQRLMNVLGIISQADKFNSTATFVAETRAIDGDQKVQTRTLYWGLGQAVYVDVLGNNAGFGRPTESGWVFSNEPEFATAAKLLLDIYEGNVDTIDFVELPVVIQ